MLCTTGWSMHITAKPERHVLDEAAKRVLHRLEGLKWSMSGSTLVTMATSAGSFRNAVAFVGFHHHPLAGAEPGVGAVGIDDAAIDHGWIGSPAPSRAATIEGWWSCHGCRDRDAAFQPHQFTAFRRGAPPDALGLGRHNSDCRLIAVDTTSTSARRRSRPCGRR